jgi:histidine decarboxylase
MATTTSGVVREMEPIPSYRLSIQVSVLRVRRHYSGEHAWSSYREIMTTNTSQLRQPRSTQPVMTEWEVDSEPGESTRSIASRDTARRVRWHKFITNDLPHRIRRSRRRILGKPTNLAAPAIEFPTAIFGLLLNNHGHPFEPCSYPLQTHKVERKLVTLVANYLGLPRAEADGFIAPSTTIATQHVAMVARGLCDQPMTAFYSANAHHCAKNTFDMLRVPSVEVAAQSDGSIDIADFAAKFKETAPDQAFVYATVGTTKKGALDDVQAISDLLRAQSGDNCWLHVDAAILGFALPFLNGSPIWDFRLPEVDSIAVSAHKFLGYRHPAGVLLMRRRKIARLQAHRVPYAGSSDLRSLGSRDGHAPLEIMHLFNLIGEQGLRDWARHCDEATAYAVQLLEQHGFHPLRNAHSNIVTFDRPQDRVIRKFDLMEIGSDRAQIFVMPHVDRELICDFVRDAVGASW